MSVVPFRFEGSLLWVFDDVYSRHECQGFIERIEHAGPQLATNNAVYRDQDRVMQDDVEVANDLFARISGRLPQLFDELSLFGMNQRLRFYRYQKGQRFRPHMDHWFRQSPTEISLLTVVAYFNDDFDGGETRFMEQLDEVVMPIAGRVAVFQHKVRHEGCEVTRGTKYAMRTDAMYLAPSEIVMQLP